LGAQSIVDLTVMLHIHNQGHEHALSEGGFGIFDFPGHRRNSIRATMAASEQSHRKRGAGI
jgi:hypothetical protein